MTGAAPTGRPSRKATGRGDDMKRIRIAKPRVQRERLWSEDLPLDPRDPDVRRAKALSRSLSPQRRAVAA
jgi:hypothetical protein